MYHNMGSIMSIDTNNNNLLSVLDDYTLDNSDDIARLVAEGFRKRISELSGGLCLPSPALSKKG